MLHDPRIQRDSVTFAWPEGKQAAVSLTFDDARPSQIEQALPILDAHGIKATFYVSIDNMRARREDWLEVVAKGHEIGNHSLTHPCSINFTFSRDNAIEDFTPERMEAELLDANRIIEEELGVTPVTFAYPCGETFVGRGENVSSYVPLVARHFLVGRNVYSETHNAPAVCDLAQVFGMDIDDRAFEDIKPLVDAARAEGGWLVFLGHSVGTEGSHTIRAEALDALCRYIRDRDNGVWVDTVAAIGMYIERKEQ